MHDSPDLIEFVAYRTAIRMHLPNADDHIQPLIRRDRAFYERAMLEDIGPRLSDAALVVDVGANIGNHTVFFAKVLGLRTLAVEPNPAALHLLRRNLALNAIEDRVELYAVALGARRVRGRMLDDDPVNMGRARITAAGEAATEADAPVECLDDIVGSRTVELLKIDVEGMEVQVLRGAARTLERCHPMLLAEAATAEDLAALDTELRPRGYRRLRWYNDTPTFLYVHGAPAPDTAAVDALPAQVRSTLPATRAIVAGMATMAGNETALRAALSSLLPQVDHLYLYLNGHAEPPGFVRTHPRITWHVDRDGTRFGDAGKFWGLTQPDGARDTVYFSCDDDIVYPPDYVARLCAELAQDGGRSVVGVHGALMRQPFDRYHADGARSVLHFTHRLMRNRRVHVLGTGTLAFHTATVSVALDDFKSPNMADLWLAQWLHARAIPAVAIARPEQWLQALPVRRRTIYDASSSADGSAFDTALAQDAVAAAMAPLTLQGGNAADAPLYFVQAGTDFELPDLLEALACSARDARILLYDTTPGAVLRRHVQQSTTPQCELHWVPHTADAKSRAAYRALLQRHAAAVRCLAFEYRAGSSELLPLPADAWCGAIGA